MADTPYDETAGAAPSPASRILTWLKTHGEQCVKDIAQALSLTPEAVRQQMAKLHAEGLVSDAPSPPRSGRGRPTQVWRLTGAGHARFRDSHAEMTVQIFDAVRASFGAEGLDKVMAARESSIRQQYHTAMRGVTSLKARVDRLVDIRRREGYMPEASRDGNGYFFVENHCPICAAAKSCLNFCRSELSIFQDVLGPDVEVTRTEHLLAGSRRCAYRIAPRVDGRPRQRSRKPSAHSR